MGESKPHSELRDAVAVGRPDLLPLVDGLIEQLEAERESMRWWRERANTLQAQLESARTIIEAVAVGKVGPAHGVLARDLISNPASSQESDESRAADTSGASGEPGTDSCNAYGFTPAGEGRCSLPRGHEGPHELNPAKSYEDSVRSAEPSYYETFGGSNPASDPDDFDRKVFVPQTDVGATLRPDWNQEGRPQ